MFKRHFSNINTKFACFLFNHFPTYQGMGRPSGDFGGHVGSPDLVMGRIWRLGDLLSTALGIMCAHNTATRVDVTSMQTITHSLRSICLHKAPIIATTHASETK